MGTLITLVLSFFLLSKSIAVSLNNTMLEEVLSDLERCLARTQCGLDLYETSLGDWVFLPNDTNHMLTPEEDRVLANCLMEEDRVQMSAYGAWVARELMEAPHPAELELIMSFNVGGTVLDFEPPSDNENGEGLRKHMW